MSVVRSSVTIHPPPLSLPISFSDEPSSGHLMTSPYPPFLLLLISFLSILHPLHGLGSSSTIAAVSSTHTLCGLVAGPTTHRIECSSNNHKLQIHPPISYDSLAGGQTFFCALCSGGSSLLCWDTTALHPKRIYFSQTLPLRSISVGHDHVCALVASTNSLKCWRGMRGRGSSGDGPRKKNFGWTEANPSTSPDPSHFPTPPDSLSFTSISSGVGFSCGTLILDNKSNNIYPGSPAAVGSGGSDGLGNIRCWGSDQTLADRIQGQFRNFTLSSITLGAHHACGFTSDPAEPLACRGSNVSGQLDVPIGESFSRVALGFDFTCGIKKSDRTVVCWGGAFRNHTIEGVSFETITAGSDFVCGLCSVNLSVICWGPGWPGPNPLLSTILPGKCVQSDCECGVYPQSDQLCSESGQICIECDDSDSLSRNPPPSLNTSFVSPASATRKQKGFLAFVVVGSVGGFAGVCSIVYCLWTGVCYGRRKVHNSVQPQITRAGSFSSNSPPSRSLTIRRQCSRVMRRQRSGTSSLTKHHHERAEEFTFSVLALATDGFSVGKKIGSGSFGVVYRGKLLDGREVAIKRGETSPKAKRFQEKETAFDSELSFLSRVHHKHLVRLVGFCQERDERLLVYEYMKNGAVYDHLHDKGNVGRDSSLVNSWRLRIKIALDAARGIEYLHSYAVPPIIHRDIKSSNILLDSNWTARVSDFGLSLMGPGTETEAKIDFKPSKAAGTVGYIDPEYYGLNVLTAKSDVYGLGVVLLELLTGKRAVFKVDEFGGVPTSVVDYAVPGIMAGELARFLDPRVGPPEANESEAVELVAYTAMHCVSLEGKDRPTILDVVANLERALALCDESHGSISSVDLSVGSG